MCRTRRQAIPEVTIRELPLSPRVKRCFILTRMRNARTISITLPPELLVKAQGLARSEHRTISELFREALRTISPGERAAIRRGKPCCAERGAAGRGWASRAKRTWSESPMNSGEKSAPRIAGARLNRAELSGQATTFLQSQSCARYLPIESPGACDTKVAPGGGTANAALANGGFVAAGGDTCCATSDDRSGSQGTRSGRIRWKASTQCGGRIFVRRTSS